MFPVPMVQLMESHAEQLANGVMHRLQTSPRCSELLRRVPGEELDRRVREICRHLNDWLTNKTESEIEERYVGLGMRRAHQGVPFTDFVWAITIIKEYLWEHFEKEGLFEEPVDFLGEVELFRNLERFFDRAIYFAAIGYESSRNAEAAVRMGVARPRR